MIDQLADPRAGIIAAYTAESALPDSAGHFPSDAALFGGRFMPAALMAVLTGLTVGYETSKTDPAFHREFRDLLLHYANRPSLLTEARNLSVRAGARILRKHEGLTPTGSQQ